MRVHILLSFVSACLLAASASGAKLVWNGDHSLGVEFGQTIKMYGNQTTAGGAGQGGAGQHKDKLEEVNSNNDVVRQAQAYADDPSLWAGPSAVSVGGVSTERIRLNNTLRDVAPGASIQLTAYLFSSAGSFAQAGETLSVPANSVKFTFGIQGWPFAATANTLRMSLEIRLDAESAGSTRHDAGIDQDKQVRMDFGGAALDVAKSALIDGVLTTIQSTITVDGEKTYLVLTFPSFSSSLLYDPTVSFVSSGPNPGPSNGASASVHTSGLVALMIGTIAAAAATSMGL